MKYIHMFGIDKTKLCTSNSLRFFFIINICKFTVYNNSNFITRVLCKISKKSALVSEQLVDKNISLNNGKYFVIMFFNHS